MPGRNFSSDKYRFGFNGKEKTDEWNGITGGNYDYGMRIYDSRLGKFLSVDPIFKKYPMLTPYQFASNTPIQGTDLDGKEVKIEKTINMGYDGNILSTVTNYDINLKLVDHTTEHNGKGLTNNEIQDFIDPIQEQIIASYSSTNPLNVINVKVNTTIVKDADPVKDLYFEVLTGTVTGGGSGQAFEIGKSDVGKIQLQYFNPNAEYNVTLTTSTNGSTVTEKRTGAQLNARTGSHELGHRLNLRHPKDEIKDRDPNSSLSKNGNEQNLMRQSRYSTGTKINNEQRKIAEKQVGKDKNLKTKTNLVEPKLNPGQSVQSPNN